MTAYYNEIDAYAAQWLRNLIASGHIAPGYVDERSIEDVTPDELRGFTQCHFFAGAGVWSLALRRAGWPDDRPVWTGSCPCQPFSAAGRGAGFVDERHLWPAWFHLITQCEPGKIFGEQVASKDGLGWLDLVQTDLEGAGYANGALDLCAAGVGSPNIRQRSWIAAERVADAKREDKLRTAGGGGERTEPGTLWGVSEPDSRGAPGGLADSERVGRERRERPSQGGKHDGENAGRIKGDDGSIGGGEIGHGHGQPGPTNSLWSAADWLYCRDGKWRPVEPGSFPLANGAPARVGRLRAYGNAINVEVAEEFIRAYLGADNA